MTNEAKNSNSDNGLWGRLRRAAAPIAMAVMDAVIPSTHAAEAAPAPESATQRQNTLTAKQLGDSLRAARTQVHEAQAQIAADGPSKQTCNSLLGGLNLNASLTTQGLAWSASMHKVFDQNLQDPDPAKAALAQKFKDAATRNDAALRTRAQTLEAGASGAMEQCGPVLNLPPAVPK